MSFAFLCSVFNFLGHVEMGYQRNKYRLFLVTAAAVLILAGCAPQIQEPIRVCPSRESAAVLLSILRPRSQSTVPIRANGQCFAKFYAEGKLHQKNFPVKLWFSPPYQVRLQGDIGFNARAIVVGSNEKEFWLSIKPEINGYWWGRWSEQKRLGKVKIDPKLVLETFGTVEVGDEASWSLSNEGAFDVLIKRNEQGAITKKMYIHSCGSLISKIEYFDNEEHAAVVAKLDRYKEISEGFSVPTVAELISHNDDGTRNSFRITLGSVRRREFAEKKKAVLFTRSKPQGFEHVYEVIDGHWLEEP